MVKTWIVLNILRSLINRYSRMASINLNEIIVFSWKTFKHSGHFLQDNKGKKYTWRKKGGKRDLSITENKYWWKIHLWLCDKLYYLLLQNDLLFQYTFYYFNYILMSVFLSTNTTRGIWLTIKNYLLAKLSKHDGS